MITFIFFIDQRGGYVDAAGKQKQFFFILFKNKICRIL